MIDFRNIFIIGHFEKLGLVRLALASRAKAKPGRPQGLQSRLHNVRVVICGVDVDETKKPVWGNIDWGAGNDLDDVASKPAPRRHPDPQTSCDSAPPTSLSRPQQRVFAQLLSSEVAAILT